MAFNPMQLATKRFFPIGLAGNTVPVGSRPVALAFDGQHLWVADGASPRVTKIQASDCAVLGTFGVQFLPLALAFDGGSVWVLAREGATTRLVKLRASNATVASANVLTPPSEEPVEAVALVFDGVCLWVGWASEGANYVTKVQAGDGAHVATVPVQVGSISDLAFDGANVWVGSMGSEGVARIRASDNVVLGVTRSVPGGNLAFDGECMWTSGSALVHSDYSVVKIRASDGAVVGSYFPKAGGFALAVLAAGFDGESIWLSEEGKVHKLRPADGVELGAWTIPGSFRAMAFDGANVWLANYTGGAVTKV